MNLEIFLIERLRRYLRWGGCSEAMICMQTTPSLLLLTPFVYLSLSASLIPFAPTPSSSNNRCHWQLLNIPYILPHVNVFAYHNNSKMNCFELKILYKYNVVCSLICMYFIFLTLKETVIKKILKITKVWWN